MRVLALLALPLLIACTGDLLGGAAPEDEGFTPFSGSFAVGVSVVVCNTGGSVLNLRAGPGTKYKILEVLEPGTAGTVLGSSGSWVRVDVGDAGIGWASGKYLCGEGGALDAWSCTGSYGTAKSASGEYLTTVFGCWLDSSGSAHGDPGDNCIPACLSEARATGLCKSSWSGKTCEQQVAWYVADSGRFGCLARLRITNPVSGKAVVAVALDAGPACWVEKKVEQAVLDLSAPVALHLFGTTSIGAADRKQVQVVEVDASTALGPL